MLLVVAIQGGLALSQEPQAQDSRWAEDALRWGRAEAAAYQISSAEEPDSNAKLIEKPVLRWSNSVQATIHGNVFLWVRQGRPVAVASIYKFFTTKDEFAAEFHSLATEPIIGRKQGEIVWEPETAGIKLADVPGAPVPAETATQRLRQMRELAGQFKAQMTDFADKEKSELRQLTTPIYRYAAEDPEVFDDGAVFAFVTATDPEVLLLLEARRVGRKSVWQYGLARMNISWLQVQHRGTNVWSVERMTFPLKHVREPYCLFEQLPLPADPKDSK